MDELASRATAVVGLRCTRESARLCVADDSPAGLRAAPPDALAGGEGDGCLCRPAGR